MVAPHPVFAGMYSTSISPTGTQIPNPITATFNIQDFAEKDYDTEGLCETSFIPAEMAFTYWFNEQDFNVITPVAVPTSEMIETGIYSTTFSLPPGQDVYSIGVEFSQYAGGGGTKCIFNGNQPNGEPLDGWLQPIFTVAEAAPIRVYVSPSFQNKAPSVSFTSFPSGKIWSGKKDIAYSAADSDRAPFGLKDFPISLYLSNDGGVIWKELVKNESNKGEYSFDTNNFPDGTNYKLKVIAIDNENKASEDISSTFGIDNTSPLFEISIGAELIKEKDKLHLTIISSENLAETPLIQITQSGGEPQTLIVDGFGKKFSAIYTVLKGHLGTAVVSIKGRDAAGNAGGKITSGETFLVSRLGPPPPTIKNIIHNESFSEQKIDILGSAPSALEVTFIFNKKDTFTVTPNENGDFSFKNIMLSSSNFGHNTLSFSSIDKNGIESDPRILEVTLNSPPDISWTKRPGGTVSDVVPLEWKSYDANNDELVFSLWYSTSGGKNWDFIAKGLLTNQYKLNTSEFFDGTDYLIKLTANDGTIASDIVSEKLVFKNNNSFSITNAPKNYIFDTIQPTMKGEMRISKNTIVSLRYSLEKETWMHAQAVDGKFNSSFEKFLLAFQEPFIDGKHIVFVEAKDDSGNVFRTFQTFIIDTLPPIVSSIDSPSLNETLNASHDTDTKLGGIQIDVSGKAEAGADLELAVNNRIHATSADNKGNFVFKNTTFLSHGINRYVLSSSDAAGNLSKMEGLILSNSAPALSFVTSQKGDFLQGMKEVKWRASDADDDTLIFQISYRRKGDKNWTSLESNVTVDSYKLDFSKFKEGAYELQVIANDGLTEIAAVEEIFVDNVLPTISFDVTGPLLVSKIKLLFSGSAADNLSGIKFVEYSLDGKSWFKALIAEGYLQKKASFVIRHPFELEDGSYDFGIRAIDAAGNISKPIFEKIVVDSTPPRIGSFTLSYSDIPILPDNDVFTVPESTVFRFIVSLERDTQKASILFDEHTTDLLKNKSTGLWEADISSDRIGTSTITISAEDVLENTTRNKTIGNTMIASRGKTTADAKISVFSRNEETQSLSVWTSAYGAENPIYADEKGEYALFLPAGTYQILVEKTGYQRLRISDFEILNFRFIDFDFPLEPRTGFRGFLEDVLERISF